MYADQLHAIGASADATIEAQADAVRTTAAERDAETVKVGVLTESLTAATAATVRAEAARLTAESRASTAEQRVAALLAQLALYEPAVPAGWRTTFYDGFAGPAVDRSKWNVRDAQGNNNEQSWLLARNVSIRDQHLIVTAKAEAAGGRRFTSGYLDTIGKFSQRGGLFQVRAKLPCRPGSTRGLWAAPLWLRGDTSPMEVDPVETWGTGPGGGLSDYKGHEGSGSGSIHQNTDGKQGKVSGWLAPGVADLYTDFHLYEVEWEPDQYVALRIDGVEKVRATVRNAPWIAGPDFAGKANLRVNLQVLSDGKAYGAPDATTILPGEMEIDWIRVLARS